MVNFTLCMGQEIVRRLAIVRPAADLTAAGVHGVDAGDIYPSFAARRAVTRLERLAAYIDHRVLRSVSWDEYGIGYTPDEWAKG